MKGVIETLKVYSKDKRKSQKYQTSCYIYTTYIFFIVMESITVYVTSISTYERKYEKWSVESYVNSSFPYFICMIFTMAEMTLIITYRKRVVGFQ